MSPRRYFAPTSTRWAARALALVLLGVSIAGIIVSGGGVVGIVYFAVVLPVPLWILAFGLDRRMPAEEREGFSIHSLIGWRRRVIPWKEIERFDVRKGTNLVVAVLRNGEGVYCWGIETNKRALWPGGSSDDIVGELNARLTGWQATTARQP